MIELTANEKLYAEIMADKGYSYSDIAEHILQKQVTLELRETTEAVAALFGRKLYPVRIENDKSR